MGNLAQERPRRQNKAVREVLRVYLVQHYQKASKHFVERLRGIVEDVSKTLQKVGNLHNCKVN